MWLMNSQIAVKIFGRKPLVFGRKLRHSVDRTLTIIVTVVLQWFF